MPHTSFRRHFNRRMSHAFFRTAQGEENAVCLVPETLKGKNVAYLFSDRSRALAQAYVLKKVRRHSFFK